MSAKGTPSVREKAQAMRAEQAKKDRKILIGIIAAVSVIVVAVIATVAVIISKQVAEESEARNVDPAAVFGDYAEAAPILFSSKGVGQTDPTVPTLVEYFDYSCHACANIDVALGEALTEGAKKGEYNLEFRSVETVAAPYQYAATGASLVVAKDAPEQWVDFHHALFAYYNSQHKAGNGSVVGDDRKSADQVKEIAKTVNVPADVINKFPHPVVAEDYLAKATKAWFDAKPEGRDKTATPEFVSNNKVVNIEGTTVLEYLESLRKGMGLK